MNPKLPRNKCLNCGNPCNTPVAKYCSLKCQHSFQQKLKFKLWDYTGEVSPRLAKKFLLITKGNSCFICGINEYNSKPIGLELDHIDGDWRNNSKDNLRLLCPNCHSQTDTYRNKGGRKGLGRPNRT
jgi:hypothetical protein